MLKKILIGLFVLIVVVVAGLYYFYTNLDSIVKVAIEKVGSGATQATVSLDNVKILVSNGSGSLSGLSIQNPRGYSSAKALSIGTITLKLDTSSLATDGPIHIREIDIEKPQITYELGSSGVSNLQTIQRNVADYAKSMGSSGGSSGGSSDGSGRKIVIDDLFVRGGLVGVSATMLKGKGLSASLPDIHLTNIGKAKGGASPAEVTQQVVGAITASATKVASVNFAKDLGSITDTVPGGASSIGDQVKGLFGN